MFLSSVGKINQNCELYLLLYWLSSVFIYCMSVTFPPFSLPSGLRFWLSYHLVWQSIAAAPSTAVSMGVWSNGNPFGVPDGLFCSFPVHCAGGGDWDFAGEFQLTEEACRQLNNSVKVSQEAELCFQFLSICILFFISLGVVACART